MDENILRVEHLSHRYSREWAIRDINFQAKNKGILGLLGSNGAGKSTTMNIVCGVLNQTLGKVYINGIDLRKNPIRAKKQIGFLPQVAPLYFDLTVYEYLSYCARLREMTARSLSFAVEEAMNKCAIAGMRDRVLKNLSGGFRQRVGIAQSIVHKPPLVILDEPTNGLDPVQIIEVRNLIKEIAHDRTVILSSHILNEIQLLCDEIVMIEQGCLVFSDSMDAFNNYSAPKSLFLEFENPPVAEALKNISGINQVDRLTAKSFRLFFDGTKAVNERIIITSVEQGWRLTQLSIEKNSMDEIFRQLTKKNSKN